LNILKQSGLDGCVVLPFTPAFAHLAPSTFLDLLKDSIPALEGLLVGQHWRFGNHQAGNTRTLSRLAGERGIELTIVPAVRYKAETISSTRIRQAVQNGDLADAARMLGRPFSVRGHVVPGDHLGRKLGFPTANLKIANEALPPQGVYTVQAFRNKTLYRGIASLGPRSTFHHSPSAPIVLEVHLLDFSGKLYGESLELFFLKHIREQKLFPSPEHLKTAIQNDRKHALEFFQKN
jgi:riboflavin kinase/FMN adenylyltransferase